MTIDLASIQTALEVEIASWWPTNGDTLIKYENTNYAPVLDDTNPILLDYMVVFDDNLKIEFGGCGAVNVLGMVVGVFDSRKGYGSGSTLRKAEILNNHYSQKIISSKVHFMQGKIIKVGEINERYRIIVTAPFNEVQEP